MPTLRNVQSGAVVSCSDDTASRLGSEWEPADRPAANRSAPVKKAPARKAAAKGSASTAVTEAVADASSTAIVEN